MDMLIGGSEEGSGGGESSLESTIQMTLSKLLIAIHIKQGRIKDKRINPSYRPFSFQFIFRHGTPVLPWIMSSGCFRGDVFVDVFDKYTCKLFGLFA